MKQHYIFDIQRGSYVDGPGIRTTVFFKGCNLDCRWCHNPESKSPKPFRMLYYTKCVGCGKCADVCPHRAIEISTDGKLLYNKESCTLCGKCEIVCPESAVKICGQAFEHSKVMSEILKDKEYYNISGGGVTFSGGEAMLHTDVLVPLLRECHEKGIHTAIDTAGNVPFSEFEKVIPHTCLFLYDIKCISESLHRQYTGVSNSLILENYTKLIERGCNVWVRVPVIDGINTGEEFERIKGLLSKYHPQKAELLPYHALGENKFRAIYNCEPPAFRSPSHGELEIMKNELSK